MKHRIRLGKLECISFITGFSLLAYELAAARILAPAIGSSTYVWTSVIGVIIASLALGFWVGGKLADQRDRATDLVWLLVTASLLVLLTLMFYPLVLELAVAGFPEVRLQAVFAALFLFAPTSFVIGTTSPYLAKLNVRSLKTTGQHIASLDALNSLGGITGTFLTGFVLFGYIGSRQTFFVVAALLLAASWLIAPHYRARQRLAVSVGVVLTSLLLLWPAKDAEAVSLSIDTATSHYEVTDFTHSGRLARGLTTGPGGIQSAVYLEGENSPVFWYAKEISRVVKARQPQSVLVLGGGAFTLPEQLGRALPGSQIDVVEIDPGLQAISERYFRYTNPANVQLIFADARTYLNHTTKTYDMIIVDVYGDASIPFTLITKEYGQAVARALAPDGVLLANVIAGRSGACKEVFDAMRAAYGQELPQAYYSHSPHSNLARTNFILLYARQPEAQQGMKPLLTASPKPYTDDYSPAERLYYSCEAENR